MEKLKLVFIHGVMERQEKNYSSFLSERALALAGADRGAVDVHEIHWARATDPLVHRYLKLQYAKSRSFWSFWTKKADPLVIQVLAYLKDKGDRETGRMGILKAVDQSFDQIFKEGPGRAIVIAHSLGALIAFDYLFCFRPQCRMKPDRQIPAFITMGSPVPLFCAAMGHAESELRLPPNIARWMNLVSRTDPVARWTKSMFKNILIDEQVVGTGFWPFRAHAGYWQSEKVAHSIADEIRRASNMVKSPLTVPVALRH